MKDLIDNLVEEGKRIGKNPWCCSMFIEKKVRYMLFVTHKIHEQESMNETIYRRALEEFNV